MAKKYDVIIIGGGPGGLTCGALLAKWGAKTLLIEQNENTGGKAVTPKTAIPGMGYFCYCQDTEGNLFGIMQSDPTAR